MANEIEFKYLVVNDEWKKSVTKRMLVVQGYVSTSKELTSRIRTTVDLKTQEKKGYITFKGKSKPTEEGASENPEYEYEIPYEEAHILIGLTELKLKKIRNIIPINDTDLKWEVDEYLDSGLNELVTSELEIKKGQKRVFKVPSWIGADVSNDPEYKNVMLARKAVTFLDATAETAFNL